MKYDFAAIEKKWQDKWEQVKPYAAVTGDKRPKFYGLIEFPYPSAAGLHVGHPRPFTAMDIICRKKRMQGYNVLNPIGFDAFGLPTSLDHERRKCAVRSLDGVLNFIDHVIGEADALVRRGRNIRDSEFLHRNAPRIMFRNANCIAIMRRTL